MDSPEETVARMTEAQKEYLLGNYNALGKWAKNQPRFKSGMVIQRQLQRRGLLGNFEQTPHGQAVRALLEKKP